MALGYLADAASGLVGGRGRWRTMPWIVLLFGLFVGPLGAVSVLLVIAQPVLFGAWCMFCLVSAAVSVAMIGPAMDEVLASLQYLRRTGDRGESVWRAFWGLQPRACRLARRRSRSCSRGRMRADGRPLHQPCGPRSSTRRSGSGSWRHPRCWDMPGPRGRTTASSARSRRASPRVAISGVTRPVRRLNWLTGAWLLVAPWVLGFPVAATANSMVIGVLLIVFASIRGTVSQRYGGGWSAIWSGNMAQGNREGV